MLGRRNPRKASELVVEYMQYLLKTMMKRAHMLMNLAYRNEAAQLVPLTYS